MQDLQQQQAAAQKTVIFATQPTPPEHAMSQMAALGIRYKVLLGSYKGVLEVSFLVTDADFEKVLSLGLVDSQESVLILHPASTPSEREAEILFLNNDNGSTMIGFFKAAPEHVAIAQDGYTYDPANQQYYIIE